MSDEELARHLNKSWIRRMWGEHGAWAMVVTVAFLGYMTGVQHNAYNAHQLAKVAANLAAEQDAARVARIRELNTALAKCSAVAVDKAEAAVDNSKQAVEGVKQIIQNQPSGEAQPDTRTDPAAAEQ